MKYKSDRIKQLLTKEIMNAIATGAVKDPRVPIVMTITRITVSKDLHYCHVYFTAYGDSAVRSKAIMGLNSSAGLFQRLIAKNLDLRFTPVIEFRYDDEMQKANDIDNLISKISLESAKEEANNNEDKVIEERPDTKE